jgi:hypothetical protein
MHSLMDNFHNDCLLLWAETQCEKLHCRACPNLKSIEVSDGGSVTLCKASHYEDCPEVRRQMRAVFFQLQAMTKSLDVK